MEFIPPQEILFSGSFSELTLVLTLTARKQINKLQIHCTANINATNKLKLKYDEILDRNFST